MTHADETRIAAATIEHEWDLRAIDWPLTEDSVVVEIGGYKGRWALQIAERYNPRLFVYEPQEWAANVCREVLAEYNAQVFEYALGIKNTVGGICFLGTDGAKITPFDSRHPDVIEVCDAAEVLPPNIDLMLMNIEGYEYMLLPYLLDKHILPQRLMVQWHRAADPLGAQEISIRRRLRQRGYKIVWDYAPALTAWERSRSTEERMSCSK